MKNKLLVLLFCVVAIVATAQNSFDRWVPTSGTNTYSTNITSFPGTYNNTTAYVKFGNTNTTNATIAINGMTAQPIRKWDGDSWELLIGGDIPAGSNALLTYDNTNGYYKAVIYEAIGSGTGGGHTIQDDGTPLTQRTNLNILNGVTASDDAGNDATLIKLGGPLIENTNIDGAFNFNFGDVTPLTGFSVINESGDYSGNLQLQSNVIDASFTDNLNSFQAGVTSGDLLSDGDIVTLISVYGDSITTTKYKANDGSVTHTSTFVNWPGHQYAADYSANFTNRSLVDKEYVDNTVAGAAYTFTDGLTEASGTVSLGGALPIGYTTLSLSSTSSFLIENSYASSALIIEDDNVGLNSGTTGNTTGITMAGSSLTISSEDATDNLDIVINGASMVVSSSGSFAGIQYGGDYSGDYVDRSLTDWGTVLGAKTFTGRQTFASGDDGSLLVGSHTADHTTATNGVIYYNSTANELRARINGAWVALGAGGGGGSPGGSDTQMQYNNGGSFGGTSTLTFNDATNLLTYSPSLVAATGNEIGLDYALTVNKATSGNYTGIKLNVTETAAPGSDDRLLDLQVGGTSKVIFGNGSAHYIDGILTVWRSTAGELRLARQASNNNIISFGTQTGINGAYTESAHIYNKTTDASLVFGANTTGGHQFFGDITGTTSLMWMKYWSSTSGTITNSYAVQIPTNVGFAVSDATWGKRFTVQTNGKVSINVGTSVTSQFQLRGAGTTTGVLFLGENSGGTERFKILDDGAISHTNAARTGAISRGYFFTGGAHTALTASTEVNDIYYDLSRTVQFATGALTTQRAFYIDAPTYSFVGASTLTSAATFAISGSPVAGTNATITNSYSLWVEGGATRLDGNFGFNVAPVGQQSVNTILVNNVTSGGTLSTIADFTDLSTYGNDAATIRNNFFRLTEKVLKLETALRNLGFTVN